MTPVFIRKEYLKEHPLREKYLEAMIEDMGDRIVLDKAVAEKIRAENKGKTLLGKVVSAAKSTVRTRIKKQKVPLPIYKERMNICRHCPTGHVVLQNDTPFSCGPLLKGNKAGACGCHLPSKCLDPTEQCPLKHWSSYHEQQKESD